MSKQRWSGRFSKKINPLALEFSASIDFDQRLGLYDALGSLIHCRMLAKQRIITRTDARKIERGLKGIIKDLHNKRFRFSKDLEDIHRNIEKTLIQRIGPVGGKLHTARSRNDQVALDLRLYCRDEVRRWIELLVKLEGTLLKKAQGHLDVIMPGYTHLQRAQPVLFAHHLLAYIEMFERDRMRLLDCFRRINILPLGASALAGTTFPINREFVAKALGFGGVSHNSLDAVSDRDFAIEMAACASLIMVHLSRLSEELILWSTSEFAFVSLPEDFCTGSSIMPQKINPDLPELVRGKTGRVYGSLMGLLTVMKGLPLAYNKDMQEDKEALFDLSDTVRSCLEILDPLIQKMKVQKKAMAAAASDSLLIATDIADFLVTKGVDFRSSHEITACLVRYATQNKKELTALTAAELKKFSKYLTPAVQKEWTASQSIAKRKAFGGTASQSVQREVQRLRKVLNASF